MNKHIHLFATEAEFVSAYTYDYVKPWFSYTRETGSVSYNKPEIKPYVEIGGIKWATMNLGATAITDYGKYYAWGDVSGYTESQVGVDKDFSGDDYVYGPFDPESAPDYGLTKYNSQDGLTTLQTMDDPVKQELGGNWRMPTKEEFETLLASANTAWTYDYQGSGVPGLVCMDKVHSSNELFFPAASYVYNAEYLTPIDVLVMYYSSSLSGYVRFSYGLTCFDDGEFHGHSYVIDVENPETGDGFERWGGCSVRGVLDE